MTETKKVWTIPLSHSPLIPCVHEWVFMGENERLIRIKYNGVVKSLNKKNNAFFFDKTAAILYRKDVIMATIKKLELQLEKKCAIIVEPSEPLPADIKL